MIQGFENPRQALGFLVATEHSLRVARGLFYNHDGWKDRRGGYLCVVTPEMGSFPRLVSPVGAFSREKGEKYLSFCQEKARRLALHPDHVSSWQSRNPEAEEWGGAVWVSAHDTILSFSGCPELGDEAIMLGTASIAFDAFGDSHLLQDLDNIAKWSNNEYWPALRDRLKVEINRR